MQLSQAGKNIAFSVANHPGFWHQCTIVIAQKNNLENNYNGLNAVIIKSSYKHTEGSQSSCDSQYKEFRSCIHVQSNHRLLDCILVVGTSA